MKTTVISQTDRELDTESLLQARQVIQACQEAKGQELTWLDVREVFDLADYFVIASARSDRQAQGMANRIIRNLELKGITPEVIEGYDDGHWILIDLGDVIAHIFYAPIREHYDLDGLWTNAARLAIPPETKAGNVPKAA